MRQQGQILSFGELFPALLAAKTAVHFMKVWRTANSKIANQFRSLQNLTVVVIIYQMKYQNNSESKIVINRDAL